MLKQINKVVSPKEKKESQKSLKHKRLSFIIILILSNLSLMLFLFESFGDPMYFIVCATFNYFAMVNLFQDPSIKEGLSEIKTFLSDFAISFLFAYVFGFRWREIFFFSLSSSTAYFWVKVMFFGKKEEALS